VIDYVLGLPDQVDQTGEVNHKLAGHCQDSVDVEDVGKGSLLRKLRERLQYQKVEIMATIWNYLDKIPRHV